LPSELERRVTALESPTEIGEDFDAKSWWWLVVLGAVVPLVCTVLGLCL
jgi:hypothetical protein